jgi:hypothetical protein
MIYVGATFVFLALQGYEAAEYLARAPGVLESFGWLGFPVRLLPILGFMKLLGIVVLALATSVTLRQGVHAVFALSAVGALVSHLGAYDPISTPLPLLGLVVVQLVAFTAWRLWLHRLALRRRYSYDLDEPGTSAVETRT